MIRIDILTLKNELENRFKIKQRRLVPKNIKVGAVLFLQNVSLQKLEEGKPDLQEVEVPQKEDHIPESSGHLDVEISREESKEPVQSVHF